MKDTGPILPFPLPVTAQPRGAQTIMSNMDNLRHRKKTTGRKKTRGCADFALQPPEKFCNLRGRVRIHAPIRGDWDSKKLSISHPGVLSSHLSFSLEFKKNIWRIFNDYMNRNAMLPIHINPGHRCIRSAVLHNFGRSERQDRCKKTSIGGDDKYQKILKRQRTWVYVTSICK